jgi:hypothetical protein
MGDVREVDAPSAGVKSPPPVSMRVTEYAGLFARS